jgi:hypothetical protein
MQPKRPDEKNDNQEKDVGFGPSHGYEKGRGGPSGPGDAPAKLLPKTRPERVVQKPKSPAAVSDAFRPECRDSLLGAVDSLSDRNESEARDED